MRITFASAVLASVLLAVPVAAQNNSFPSNDWNSSWGFSSTAERSLRLLQADLIEKGEGDYYDQVGTSYNTIYQNIQNDNSQGQMRVEASDGATIDVHNHTGDDIGQSNNTNVIGAINQSETTIDIEGTDNIISAINGADSTGCQDGGISIDSTGPIEARTCN